MPASRDLLMLFIALELVSAPGFLMAAFRKADLKVERGRAEVLPHRRAVDRGDALRDEPDLRAHRHDPAATRSRAGSPSSTRRSETLAFAAILFVVVGFAFKVSAVPFQFWAPDTYEGAPVPVAAFLAVASSGGRVRRAAAADVRRVPRTRRRSGRRSSRCSRSLTMTLGNLVALQQTAGGAAARVLRDRAGRVHPAAVRARVGRRRGQPDRRSPAAVAYILIYAVMNIGAFAVATAVAEREPEPADRATSPGSRRRRRCSPSR